MEKTVLAIDPGTSKCGMALVRRREGALQLLWHEVVERGDVTSKLHEAYFTEPYALVVIGGGTGSGPIVHDVRAEIPSIGILVVEERDTTLQARERYWEHNPRKGWRRLLPASLQLPEVPYDDFVAFILAERVLWGEE
ncbi:resolvase [soil metagenome]